MPTLVEIEIAIKQNEGTGPKRAFVFLDDQNLVEFTMVTTIEGVQFAQEHNLMNSVVNLSPGDAPPGNGDTYDPTVFDPDKYGRAVSGTTDLVTDTYYVGDGPDYSVQFPSGTTLVDVYQKIEINRPSIPDIDTARSLKTAEFSSALNVYFNSHYDPRIEQQLVNLYLLAKITSLANRAAYLLPLINWIDSVMAYSVQFTALIQSTSDPAEVSTLSYDIDANVIADPQLTLSAAMQIID